MAGKAGPSPRVRFSRVKSVTLILVLLAALPAFADSSAREVVIAGSISHDDHQTYILREFEVPEGIEGITLDFEHDGVNDHTVIDLGLVDPAGFRGWTGSNKNRVEISAFDSTPGYRNGPILGGTWALLLGIPNAREGVETRYRARITLHEKYKLSDALLATGEPIDASARWYRGDLHTHTGHSDGYCLSGKGTSVPCPVHLTVEAGAAAGLDFLAITDHNTLSHHQSLRELQPHYDDLLLMPGREITTFFGHANVFGASDHIDHRVGPTTDRSVADLLDDVRDREALFSINHPSLPSGEACMGCGWQLHDVDFRRVDAIEVINGGSNKYFQGAPEAEAGIEYWHAILDRGFRVTAVGGSDNHDAKLSRDGRQSPVGVPATVVYAEALSMEGIFAGIRSGRVYVDLSGDADTVVDLRASSGPATADMGGSLSVGQGAAVNVEIRVLGGEPGNGIELISRNGQRLRLKDPQIKSSDETRLYRFVSKGGYDWVRVNLRDSDGKLSLLTNPIYVNAPGENW
jgi:hypothetical protein